MKSHGRDVTAVDRATQTTADHRAAVQPGRGSIKKMLFPTIALLMAVPAAARPLTPSDLVSMSRISGPTVSPDDRWLVWEQQETDIATDGRRHDLWRLDLTRKGATPETFASGKDTDESAPAFASDGWLYFLRDGKDGQQAVYRVSMRGGPPARVTGDYDLSGFKVSPEADAILIWADRPPGARSLDTVPAESTGTGSGRTYDRLFVRHWNQWADGRRSQLFVLPMRNGQAFGAGRNIAPSLIGDAPSKPFGGGEEIAWSADGRSIYFALREAGRIEPLSINFDIFAAASDAKGVPTDLTRANRAIDTLPTVSPDGRWLAWVATARPGYEADRHVLWVRALPTGEARPLTGNWDRSVDSVHWANDSKTLYVTAADRLDHPVFRVDLGDGSVRRMTGAGNASNLVSLAQGGFVFQKDSLTEPPDFWKLGPDGHLTRLTAINARQLAGIDWPAVTRFSFAGAGGDRIWGLALRPAALPPEAKAAVAFLVHGGPQSTFSDSWSYRWNMAAWAGHGYGVVAIDFHGSTGYGQAFTDSVVGDWGGRPLVDLRLGLQAALAKFDFLDGDNVCAAGGSYGGYMMNWIEGKWPDRFRCLVQHDGIFDERAMTFETDELAPDEWDFGNKPYFETPEDYEKWNPVNFVGAWKTPQLVITGERDFRSPTTQAIAAFTALQMRGVPSRLLVFPDQGHVVEKPKNSLQWHDEIFGWIDRWTGRAQPRKGIEVGTDEPPK